MHQGLFESGGSAKGANAGRYYLYRPPTYFLYPRKTRTEDKVAYAQKPQDIITFLVLSLVAAIIMIYLSIGSPKIQIKK
jgi:hypothetical protein